jgi:gamma-glutamyltranspeptidase/glutathione hydrolase
VELALAVCYPAAGNLGGGGFWVVYQPNGKVHTLDYRERAPQQASRNMFLDETGEVIPGLSTQSILSSGVPGTVAGLVMAHEKFGSLPWKRLVQPAIDLAQKGFPLTEAQANDFNRLKKDFLERNSWTVPFVHDTLWNEGDTLVQPDLAETLKRIRDEGKAGFYSGTTAQFLISQSEALQGLLSKTDLEAYEAKWREPITGTFRDLEFYSMAPPSSGGVALKQLLGLVEIIGDQFDGHNSPNTVHLMAECEKLVYADRADYLGDPDFVSVPVDHLTDPNYLKLRASLVKAETATPADQISAGAMPPAESQETTHFSIADKWGNAVAVTTTLNAGYGNKIVVRAQDSC